jgi:hypothetical protein
LFSKESAVLLPLLLLVAPGAVRPLASRLAGVAVIGTAAAGVLWWRAQAGAITPFSSTGQYNLNVPLSRLIRNGSNYAGRLLPSPLALVVATGAAALLGAARARATTPALKDALPPALFGLAWTVVFLAPTLPIVARNELYLYMPSFGVCLAAAALAGPRLAEAPRRRMVVAALVIYALALGGYQLARANELHRDLVFSQQLTDALAARAELRRARSGFVSLVPATPESRRYLDDVVGGYLPVVLRHVFGRTALDGAVARGDVAPPPGSVFRLRCSYDGGIVSLR